MENTLPLLYAKWMRELIGIEVTGEPRSTCLNCRMGQRPEIHAPSDRTFLPNVKCCGFNPAVPNFLVGGILSNDTPEFAEGRALFERMAPMQSVGPLGVGPSDLYNFFYACKPFGQVVQLRCPYY